MADKSLVMTFLNAQGSKASITLPAVKDGLTETEIAAAMDTVITPNIFSTSGGDLVAKSAAQITETNVTAIDVQ